jgi:hypothetical protein
MTAGGGQTTAPAPSRTVIAMMRVMLGLGIAWHPAAKPALAAAETAARCGAGTVGSAVAFLTIQTKIIESSSTYTSRRAQ